MCKLCRWKSILQSTVFWPLLAMTPISWIWKDVKSGIFFKKSLAGVSCPCDESCSAVARKGAQSPGAQTAKREKCHRNNPVWLPKWFTLPSSWHKGVETEIKREFPSQVLCLPPLVLISGIVQDSSVCDVTALFIRFCCMFIYFALPTVLFSSSPLQPTRIHSTLIRKK